MRDSRGWTALHCASVQDNILKLGELIVDRRADVNLKVESMSGADRECTGATPLHLAVIHNNLQGVEILLANSMTDVNALFHRRIYFDDSLYVSRPRWEGWTALRLVTVAGLPEVVKALMMRCPEVCICLHINSP